MKHRVILPVMIIGAVFLMLHLPAKAQPPFTIKPSQICLLVDNPDKSASWFSEMLGFALVEKTNSVEQKTKTCLVKLNDFYIELTKREDTYPRSSISIPEDSEICGICKIGFKVTDFEDFHQQVKQLHPEQVTDIITSEISGSVYFFMYDPDHNMVQIFPSSNPKDSIRIKPYLFGITVDNMENAINWYEQNLGFAFFQKWDINASNTYVRLLFAGSFLIELRKDKINPIHPSQLTPPQGKTTLMGYHMMTFKVDDIQAFSDLLKTNQILPIKEITTKRTAWSTSCMLLEDAEKNLIQIIQ